MQDIGVIYVEGRTRDGIGLQESTPAAASSIINAVSLARHIKNDELNRTSPILRERYMDTI